jgi:N-acetylglucosamine kinase-like BadF-type ATPase
MTYFAAIDGGGTGTKAAVADAQGNIVGQATAGASNYLAVGLDTAFANVRNALQEALAQASASELPENCVIGLAGVARSYDYDAWKAALAKEPLARKTEICGDAELLFYALPERKGVVLICGTGSIGLGRDGGGQTVRVGGWGHYLGDEGSGLWFGRNALTRILRTFDGREQPTLLTELVMREWSLHEPTDILRYVYGEGKRIETTKIAALAGLVFAAAEQRDSLACELIETGATELGRMINTCRARLNLEGEAALGLGGGLILNRKPLKQGFLAGLDAGAFGTIIEIPSPSVAAAQAIAKL